MKFDLMNLVPLAGDLKLRHDSSRKHVLVRSGPGGADLRACGDLIPEAREPDQCGATLSPSCAHASA